MGQKLGNPLQMEVLMVKSSRHGGFSMALLDYGRVIGKYPSNS